MSNIKNDVYVNYDAKLGAFPYQAEAFSAVKDLTYSAIFHEQGLGKTKIAIDLCLYWLKAKDIDSVLIVTKKQLIKNWIDEFKFHTFLKPDVLNTDKANNYFVFNGVSKVILTNFETVVAEKERLALFLKCRNVAIIIDESAKLKNPEANITKVFFDLSDSFQIKAIMTGTPVANRPYDIWSQIYFLDKGQSLGTNFAEFKKICDLSNNLASNDEARRIFEDSVGSIFSKIDRFTVRETKKSCGLALPEKQYFSVYTMFSEKQSKIYTKIINDYCVEITKDGAIVLDNDEECLKRLLRLNQVASNPRLIDDSYSEISGKEQQLDILLKTIIDRNEKCIVWSSYIENINLFAKKYKEYGAVRIHGGMAIEDRNRSVELFKKNVETKVLFATPQAAKEGLTLTVANNAVFYDRTFNLDDYLQAQDRIHRISQKKKCNIYLLLIKNSIDDWISALLTAKQNAASLAQGDITKEDYCYSADYTYAEIIKQLLGEKLKDE